MLKFGNGLAAPLCGLRPGANRFIEAVRISVKHRVKFRMAPRQYN